MESFWKETKQGTLLWIGLGLISGLEYVILRQILMTDRHGQSLIIAAHRWAIKNFWDLQVYISSPYERIPWQELKKKHLNEKSKCNNTKHVFFPFILNSIKMLILK